jgi:ankyrin repeat protein
MRMVIKVMGNCTCTASKKSTKQRLKADLVQLIDGNYIFTFTRVFNTYVTQSSGPRAVLRVDEAITTLTEVRLPQVDLSALGYAVRLGRLEIVKYLLEEAGASLGKLCEVLATFKKSPLDILCENGHLPLLKYLLPQLDSMQTSPAGEPSVVDESLFATAKETTRVSHTQAQLLSCTYTAVQRAADKGHFEVVKYLHKYYKHSSPPLECDLHHIDETTGENCALLAAKSGNLQLLHFLYYDVKADFFVLSYRRESAVQLAIVGSRRGSKVPYLHVVKFLCEVVGLDLAFEYEEALLVAEDPEIVAYIENTLGSRGINVAKAEIDRLNEIKGNQPVEEGKSLQLPSILANLANDEAHLSSIRCVSESGALSSFNW